VEVAEEVMVEVVIEETDSLSQSLVPTVVNRIPYLLNQEVIVPFFVEIVSDNKDNQG